MFVQLRIDSLRIYGLSYDVSYQVLAIEFHSISENPDAFTVNFRILSDHGTPGLFNSRVFNIIEASMPSDFIFRTDLSGNIEIGPSSINFQGFWESFFNDDESSRRLFKTRFPELADQLF